MLSACPTRGPHPKEIVLLVIPDKRYCFDFLREKSSLARVVDALGRNNHTEGAIAEYFLTVASKNGNLARGTPT